VARTGTTDDKGPALAALSGARLALQDGVRLNFQFLWETEEEMGSPSFQAAAEKAGQGDKQRAPLRTDSIVVSDTLWRRRAGPRSLRPAAALGFLRAPADRRQGRSFRHHRGARPAIRLANCARSSNACYDARTGRVKIPDSTATCVNPARPSAVGLRTPVLPVGALN